MQEVLSAVLVGIQLPHISEAELKSSLLELGRLATTLGYNVIGQLSQKRSTIRGATVLGEGKLKELAFWTGGSGIVTSMVPVRKNKATLRLEKLKKQKEESSNQQDPTLMEEVSSEETSSLDFIEPQQKAQIVIFDGELSPSQLRNLTKALGVPVLDRTGVIIEIFGRHAKTKAARLQVEIARLTYIAPRLRETAPHHEDRQAGGIGGKGAGETSLELDRRNVRDRIKELKQELKAMNSEHETRRSQRQHENCVTLVGYTNAGKSSLMRALTGSDVLVADQLFATLDTTVRTLFPESRPKILISDTVGFIHKLPHHLIASFKSTLDEALHASLLLYVVDASDPSFPSQLHVTQKVLEEVGAHHIPHLLVLNKKDRLNLHDMERLQTQYPQAILISTRNQNDIHSLREKLIHFFEQELKEDNLYVPYSSQGIIGEIRSKMNVLSESYDETGVHMKVRASHHDLEHVKSLLN